MGESFWVPIGSSFKLPSAGCAATAEAATTAGKSTASAKTATARNPPPPDIKPLLDRRPELEFLPVKKIRRIKMMTPIFTQLSPSIWWTGSQLISTSSPAPACMASCRASVIPSPKFPARNAGAMTFWISRPANASGILPSGHIPPQISFFDLHGQSVKASHCLCLFGLTSMFPRRALKSPRWDLLKRRDDQQGKLLPGCPFVGGKHLLNLGLGGAQNSHLIHDPGG